MSNLTSLAWWKAAFFRALRTVAAISTPYVPIIFNDGVWLLLLSTAGFGALSSFVTSLWGISETKGQSVTWYWAVFERVVKTAAQALLTAFGTATMFSEVQWDTIPALVGSAVLGSLLIAALQGLPEAEPPLAKATLSTVVVNPAGEPSEAAIPVIAVADSTVQTEIVGGQGVSKS